MHTFWRFLAQGLVIAVCAAGASGAASDWAPLFNGRDLSGWVNVNCAPNTFSVREGMIVSTGVPTGVMRTERQYENFELELEWRHMKPKGNAGLFVWSAPLTAPGTPFAKAIEVQILDGRNGTNFTSHGDVFAIHGATFKPDRPHPGGWMRCLPSEWRANPAGHWNHYRVLCSNGVVQLAVNGKVVSGGSESKPRKGYLCLESEGSECHFRNIRLRELPSTGAPPEETAPMAEPFRPLYTGIDLSGWRMEPGLVGHWRTNDWRLEYDGKAEGTNKHLWTEKEFGDFVLVADWRFTRKPEPKKVSVILPNGDYGLNDDGSKKTVEVPDAGDSGIYLRGSLKAEVNIWNWPIGSGEMWNYRHDTNQPPAVRAGATPRVKADAPLGQWNRFVITLRGDRVSIQLNDKWVIENAQLPGIPRRGPIGLQHHGDPIEFANLFVQELD
jgi:hypothetical protein